LLDKARRSLFRLAPPGARVVIATSGGPDSQTLLDLCGRLRVTLGWAGVWALGVDHRLRPEAAQELTLAAELARSHGIPFETVRVTVSRRGNLLAAARRARYAALMAFADRVGADRIAVAHTATDQVETILHNLSRGAALNGAGGMRPRRGRLVRPLLAVGRREVEAYVAERGLACAQDPSNRDERRSRVRLRHEVLPVLRLINPEMEAAVGRFAAQAQRDDALLQRAAQRELVSRLGPLDSLAVAGATTLPQPLLLRMLRAFLLRHRLPADRALLKRLAVRVRTGQGALTVRRVPLRIEAGRLWAVRPGAYTLPLPVPGSATLPGLDLTLTCAEAGRERVNLEEIRMRRDTVAFDADRLHSELQVRSFRAGDRLWPFGLAGSLKVGDLFTNKKVPRSLRASWPLLWCGDQLLWVVGLRRSDAAAVNASTRRVLTIGAQGAWAANPW